MTSFSPTSVTGVSAKAQTIMPRSFMISGAILPFGRGSSLRGMSWTVGCRPKRTTSVISQVTISGCGYASGPVRYLLLLSKGDTWGFVVPEALANGVIPVVSPGVGCAADVVAPLCEDLIVADTSQALRVIQKAWSPTMHAASG